MARANTVRKDEDAAEQPRPKTAAEIARLMDEADARAAAPRRRRARGEVAPKPVATTQDRPGPWHVISFALVWGGILAALGACAWFGYAAGGATVGAIALAIGLLILTALLVTGAAVKASSPLLLTGVMLRRAAGRSGPEAVQLAGSDMLTALGIAEKVLDCDQDARLVSRRDGVVAYANRAYHQLAEEAGVVGPAGLPPRIDRLFAQQGAEATKLFRLCRAAKSAAPAEEVIYQFIGLEGGGRRRRFEVSVRPISGADDHVAWRLRELPVEETEHDVLAASYADYIRPVFAIERSGQIAWANAAARSELGVDRAGLRHIDDIVLGETAALTRALWTVDSRPHAARVRRRGGDPVEGKLAAFRRGGVGEGFVVVDLELEDERDENEDISVSGDIAEAPFGVAVVEGEFGRDARIIEANKAFTDVFGGAKKNAPLSRSFAAEALDELGAEIRKKQSSGGAPRPVEVAAGENGARAFALYARPVRRRRGGYGVRRTLLYSVDVTDRKRMEEDHAQDQKLKAIGHLAGEVAHDFNNLLQVVLGNCERLMLKHPAGDPAYRDLVLIRENAQRAANMTKQLLAFSRKQTLKREATSITELLRDFARFLDRAVGEKVDVDLVNGRGLPMVRIDRHQLETALTNLAVNARDAMGASGGVVTIRTSLVPEADMAALVINGLAVADHLLIEVEDTGSGVPQDIADKIFDPFFTTKDIGKGTGLGLSTVHGIIGQMEGAILLAPREEGKGATFRIYLPAFVGAVEEEAPAAYPAGPVDLTGAGRILVVEDEDAVRNFVVAALEDCGYEVTSVGDGEEALEALQADTEGFDLVITDVMMPVVDGPTLVARARAEQDLKARILFMSAYAENSVRDQLDSIDGAGYIQKPFALKSLAAKVKETLAAEMADA